MATVNRVILMGNLTRKPETRQTAGGMAVLDMGLAVSDNYRNKEGEVVESKCFTDIVVWGRQAETCAQYLTKGSAVLVEGRLQYDQWQTESGEKRNRLRVRAERVQFLGKSKNGETAGTGTEDAGGKSNGGPAAEADEAIPF